MRTRNILFGILASTAIVGLSAALYYLYHKYDEKSRQVESLQTQVKDLERQEKQSAVMQSVNAQMEEIALQERRISDEQREAAERQTVVAERMRQHAEQERQNALEAEHRAVQASQTAESQRRIAEDQRAAAEHSKRVADTLSYLTLSRQIGNYAITQYHDGNIVLANLLAYAAYQYTKRYGGDIYNPSVYQALVMTSQSKHQWTRHQGTVTDIAFFKKGPYSLASTSTYGELLAHRFDSEQQLLTDTLYANKSFDFRDLFIDHPSGTLFAVSRTGHLLIRKDGRTTIRTVEGIGRLMGIEPVGGQFIVIGEEGLTQLTPHSWHPDKTRRLSHKIMAISLFDGRPLLFDDHRQMLRLNSIDDIPVQRVPVSGQVTAFASSKNTHVKTYGMADGTIWMEDAQGKMHKLLGHRSRVSRIKINGARIYSASYDGTVNLWMSNKEKIEPMSIIRTNGWLRCFTFDEKKHNLWCGDQKGTLTEAFISVPLMTSKLQKQLKRNLTHDEWSYYIGRNIPYEAFTK